MNNQDIFKQLLDNAFDFLEESIAAFELKPKYSLIHLCAAVELFLKARLCLEHWTLIVIDKKLPSQDQIENGQFRSVNMAEAIERLAKVLPDFLTNDIERDFRNLAESRSVAVHFSDLGSSKHNMNMAQASVAARLHVCLFHLRQLLAVNKWTASLGNWNQQINRIQFKLKGIREYLQLVREEVQSKIDIKKAEGYKIETCPACGFDSCATAHRLDDVLTFRWCLVCGLFDHFLKMTCPECEQDFETNDGYGDCSNVDECKWTFTPKDLVKLLTDSSWSPKDLATEGFPKDCPFCGYEGVVIPFHEHSLCVCCIQTVERHNYNECHEDLFLDGE